MVKPTNELKHQKPGDTGKYDTKHAGVLKGIVNRPDIVRCCVRVRPHILDGTALTSTESRNYQLALISRDDKACLFILEDQPSNMPPIIHKALPILSDFSYTIAQAPAHDKPANADFLVSFGLEKDESTAIGVSFCDEQDMVDVIEEVRAFAELARKNVFTSSGGSHRWVDVYAKFGRENPSRKYTMSVEDDSAIPYVLPIKRSDSTAFVKLRRAGSLAAAKAVREVTATAAKQHWISARMKERENDFVNWDTANIFVGTWNVHGSLPTENMAKWIVNQCKVNGEQMDPDFYVIGLQEMETANVAYARYDPRKENAWVDAILEALGPNAEDYCKVATQQLVTILIIVIARRSHQPFITDIDTSYVGVGLMNMMGNKGGVGVRFRFHDSYLCFVASHLAAYTDQVDRRNQDFAEICKRMVFKHREDEITSYVSYSWSDGGDEGVSFLENHGVVRDWSGQASVFHSDYLIWLGDLNYRLNLTEPEVKSMLRQKQLDMLLEYDQLSIERQAGRAFPMFEEGKINFMPTYKYDAGTNQYDSSGKRRAPAWTDRILWKKERVGTSAPKEDNDGKPLKLLEYGDCMDMMLSDHKPVRALFQTKIRKVDSRKQAVTKDELIRQLIETKENTTRGQISSSFVEFGDVRFMEYKEKTLTLENTGQVLAPFRFISKLDETEVCPSWLHVHPLSGVLGPGEKVVIHFEILIDPSISTPFNEGSCQIDNILVLRLENGKDFFIVVSGKYQPTCFGVNLERLALMTLPISEASRKGKRGNNQTDLVNEARTQQATLPKELWRVLNFLWNKNMLSMDTLFLQHGDRVISEYVRRCLDTGDQFDTNVLLNGKRQGENDEAATESSTSDDTTISGSNSLESQDDKEANQTDEAIGANSMIDVLVAFLECLPEPVIPSTMYKQALEAAESIEAMNELKDKLPYIHLNVLLYLTSFLKDAIAYAPASRREERRIRIVEMFTVLLRPPFDYKEQNPALARQRREKFVMQLLTEGGL